MDLGVKKHKIWFRTGAATSVESVKGVNGKEATEAEKESLLGSEEKTTKKKRLARKVQWNDRKGNDLVEVLEFEPRFVCQKDWVLQLDPSLWAQRSSLQW